MDEQRFRYAVECNRDTVFRVAYTYLRDAADADDVTQDVFYKLLTTDKGFLSDAHVRNWLVRVTVNECRSLFRRPWRRVEDIEAYANALQMPSEDHVQLFTSVMRLPERYRVPRTTLPRRSWSARRLRGAEPGTGVRFPSWPWSPSA